MLILRPIVGCVWSVVLWCVLYSVRSRSGQPYSPDEKWAIRAFDLTPMVGFSRRRLRALRVRLCRIYPPLRFGAFPLSHRPSGCCRSSLRSADILCALKPLSRAYSRRCFSGLKADLCNTARPSRVRSRLCEIKHADDLTLSARLAAPQRAEGV